MGTDPLARLGPSPLDLSRKGSTRVLQGNSLILKAGPAESTAREALVLGELSLELQVPELVDSGDGWVLFRSIEVAELDRAAAVADLARLHDAFADAPLLGDARLRDVFGRELPELLERAAKLDPPEPFRGLIEDPSPLLAELRSPITFVHGDCWPGNVLGIPGGGRCWIDWEEAGAGHAALDLANWLYGSPWVPPSPDPEAELDLYLAARAGPINPVGFRRAVDAAVVLLFILLDLRACLGSVDENRREIARHRAAVARQFA